MSQDHPLTPSGAFRQAQLREFSKRVSNIQGLNEGGKLGEETSFLMIRKLWNELQHLRPAPRPRRIERPGA